MCANQKILLTGDFAFLFRLYTWAAMLAAINLNFSMKGKTTVEIKTKFLIAMQLCSIVLLTSFVAASASAQTSAAASITPPPVPTDVQVEEGNVVFLVGHATGTQNYSCLPCDPSKPGCANGVAFTLFTPQATLFNEELEQVTTHFFSPNPFENGVIRATWQHSRDTSTVWGRVIGSSTDPNFVKPGAIAWLLVNVKDVGVLAGPTGGDRLTKTTFIQRLNTVGGVAPSSRCSSQADIGRQEFVPYKADYFFYKQQ
jgi:Protein of unknown function (DUF3455)